MYLTGAKLVVDALVEEGVDTIFAITGAGNLALLDEVARRKSISVHFLHHEQAVVMAAQGYARVSQRIGVAVVTTGGGTSNAMTGILSAHLDSIPVLVISGNESSFHCNSHIDLRAWGVQGFDSIASFGNITKFARRVQRGDCPYAQVRNAIAIAQEDRMGPVHLDFPMDLQRSDVCGHECSHEEMKKTSRIAAPNNEIMEELVQALLSSSRPVLYIGNGCRRDNVLERLEQLIDLTKLPFFLSWSGIDLFPQDHPGNLGRVGIYGERSSNLILQNADFVLCLGTRLAIPQIGYDKNDFARNAQVWVVDIDPSELEKFSGPRWRTVNASVADVIAQTFEKLSVDSDLASHRVCIGSWIEKTKAIREKFNKFLETEIGPRNSSYLHSVDFVGYLNRALSDDAVIVTDVGAGLLSGHYAYEQSGKRRLFTSQGLGEMGFGLPAAIGAYFAAPNRQLICLNTDGAIMFNLQELQSVKHFEIPLKLVIFNNEGYAMIKVSQSNLFEGREFGSSSASGLSFPDFESLARLFGFDYQRISNIEEINDETEAILGSERATIIEVVMDPDQKYLPRLATNKNADGTLVSPPLEDLDPKVSLDVLTEILEGNVHESSKRIDR
jgi:acetolactate synthase-1/2/3 large subunit